MMRTTPWLLPLVGSRVVPTLAAAAGLALVACGQGAPVPAAGESGVASAARAAGETARVTEATRAAGDSALIGRLVDEVAPDSAYLSAWGVYPLERHIGIVLARVGTRHYLLADTLVGYDGPRARWRIRQAQPVEAPGAGEAWVGSCAIGDADASDGTVVARVTLSAGEALTPIHRAWRLDPATWSFREFPVDSLSCYNEGGG